MARVYHIRRKLRPLRGSQYYRDRGERYAGTLCGSQPTDLDISWREKALGWTRMDGELVIPCENCKRIAEEQRA